MEPGWMHRGLPWLLVLISFLAVCFPITNTDIWWHLAAGRTILERGLLFTDPFSSGTGGQPWTDVHWLFQLLVVSVHAAFGLTGLVLLKCSLFAAATWLLLRTVELKCSSRFRGLAVALLVVVAVAGRGLVFMRPVVLTLLFVSIFLWVLARARHSGNHRVLWLLPLVQVVWSNVQALFVLGPLVLGCILAGELFGRVATRAGLRGFGPGFSPAATATMVRVGLLVLGACIVSPYGFDNLALAWKLFVRTGPEAAALFSQNVSENLPLWALDAHDSLAVRSFPWIAFLAFGSFLLRLERISLGAFLLLVALFVPALAARRNVLLFDWIAAPVALTNLFGWLDRRRLAVREWFQQLAGGALPALAVVMPLGFVLGGAARNQVGLDRPAPFRVPLESAEVLDGLDPGGSVFCSVRYGGYLAWRLHPRWRPFIDGRLVIRTADQFSQYLQAVDHPKDFDRLHRQHRFAAVLLPAAAPERYRRLVYRLLAHPDWQLAHTDGTEVLFLPAGAGPGPVDLDAPDEADAIVARLVQRYGHQPAVEERAVVHLASLLMLADRPAHASRLLADRPTPFARTALARSRLLEGDTARARALALESLQQRPADPVARCLLARCDLAAGDPAAALRNIRQALQDHPGHPEANQLLDTLLEGLPPEGNKP